MKSHEFITESRTSGRGEWVHPAMRSPRRGPDPEVKHNFNVGDEVMVPTRRGERFEMRKGIVKQITHDKVGVAGHNAYYPKSVQWFPLDKVEATVFEGEALPSVDTPTVGQIADKFGYPMSYIMDQLRKGIEVEYEHTQDAKIAKEIALDHIAEHPDYYDKHEAAGL